MSISSTQIGADRPPAATTAHGGHPRGLEERSPLPYPSGWFAACFSHDLGPRAVLTVPFMGRELVLYRTSSGQARAVNPYCPHLGAHLGHGGRVEGENLVCPFHGLAFAPDGECVRAGDGHKPPRASLTCWPVREVNHAISIWWDEDGRPPSWEVPEADGSGYSRPRFISHPLGGYVQDMMENSVDWVHFAALHRFTEVSGSARPDGCRMGIELAARWHGLPIRVSGAGYGLGHMAIEVEVGLRGLRALILFHATPTAPLQWTFRFASALRIAQLERWPARAQKLAYAALGWPLHRWLVAINVIDHSIWNNRRYLERPKLMASEGGVALHRRWAAQFYPAAGARGGGEASAATARGDEPREP